MTNPSLATSVASITLESCIFNASGPRTGSGAALSKIAQSSSGAILAKSATLVSQKGNDLPRTWHHEANPNDKDGFDSHASLNSEGLPNSGIDYYLSKETIDEAVGDSGKPYLVRQKIYTRHQTSMLLYERGTTSQIYYLLFLLLS